MAVRKILSLIAFGIAFGYLEASVVVYLRALAEPLRVAAGLPPHELFPLVDANRLGSYTEIVKLELGREAATIVMLVTLAAAARPARWLPAFALAFGTWDLTFYLWLKLLTGWPQSLLTWDILFLVPVPWTSPVLAPVIVSSSLIIGGIIALIHPPQRIRPLSGWLLALGGALVILSFTWDWRTIAASAMPHDYRWPLFAAGEIAGIAGLVTGLRTRGAGVHTGEPVSQPASRGGSR